MKKVIAVFVASIVASSLFAATVTTLSTDLVNSTVYVQTSIKQVVNSDTTTVYVETQEPRTDSKGECTFEIGKGTVLREGKDVTVVATGICVGAALEAAEMLAADGIDAEVINICTIKPLDKELIAASAKKTGRVVTAEEHSVIGGLGSAVCDALSELCPTPVKKIGMQDVFGESGPADELVKKYGLDAKGIYTSVKDFVK